MAAASPFASRSVTRHYVRGAAGLLLLVAAIAGAALLTPAALLLLVGTAVAWRGCPTCWTVGLVATRAACAAPEQRRTAARR